jgi:tyrosine-protein kinase Etk/Wzc
MNSPQPPNSYPQTPYYAPLEDESFDFKRYLSLFISNWYWFAISFLIASIIAYGINRYGDKVFTVTSTLLIKDQQNGGSLSNQENIIYGAGIFNNQQNLKNEMGILRSYSLNLRVMDSLPDFRVDYFGVGKRNIVESRLYTRCPFIVVLDSKTPQPGSKVSVKILSDVEYSLEIDGKYNDGKILKFGERYIENGFNFKINLRNPDSYKFDPAVSNKYYFFFANPIVLANTYRSKLNVNPIDKDATLVTLVVSGTVPEQEADYLNKLMDIYISQGVENKNRIADSTLTFIDRQLKTISDSLSKTEDKLQNFRLENKLVDISKEGSVIQDRLEQVENEKSMLELQKKYYQYLQEYIDSNNESGDIISPSSVGINDSGLGKLVENLADLQQKKQKLLMNLFDELPPLNLLNEGIINARNTLAENVRNSLLNIENSMESLNNRLAKVNSDLIRLPVTERKLIGIQRKFDVDNTVYTYLLEKRAETGIAKASNVSDNRIIDRAEPYNCVQIRPKRGSNNIKALILGLLIPGVIMLILFYLNNRIIDNGDILSRTKVPIIGYIGHSEGRKELPVVESPGSSLAESFRSVRTTLKYLIKDERHPVIMVTSTIGAEGKTFVSINLAAIIAMLGKKVLLVGLDLRKPRIHKILSIDNSEGFSTYLSSNCEYSDIIKETSIDNLFYATSGPVPPNPAELINGHRMKEFIERAKKEYDFILIDTPPVAVVSDTLLLADFTDVNIFIVRQRYSSKNTIDLIQELYQDQKLKNMGIIINDISLTGYYGYGLRYGYYKGYGYSYGKDYYGQYSYSHYGHDDKEQAYYD